MKPAHVLPILLLTILAAPVGAQVPSQDQFTLRPGDGLRISVWPREEYGGEFVVEETGYIHLPLLGQVQAADIPIGQLRADLRQGYAQAIQNPVVTIVPTYNIGVLGAVRSPGIYQVTPSQNLLDVIGMAGGFTAEAEASEIRIVRQGQVVEIDAERALERGELTLTQLPLRSGDQIVVPVARGIDWNTIFRIFQTAATVALLVERLAN